MKKEEIESWRFSAVILVLVALVLFVYNQFIHKIFVDIVFPLCLIYIPAIVSVIIYLKVRKAGGRSRV